MGMISTVGPLGANLPSTFQANAINGGKPVTSQMAPNIGLPMDQQDPLYDVGPGVSPPPIDPGYNAGAGFGGGKNSINFPTPGTPGGKGSINLPGQPNMPTPPSAAPNPPATPLPGPGYVGGIRVPPANYRPPNPSGGILRSRRTGMPIVR